MKILINNHESDLQAKQNTISAFRITVRVLILAEPYFSGNRWKFVLSNNYHNHELAHLPDSL